MPFQQRRQRLTNANVKQRSSETLFGTPIRDVAGAVLLWKKLFLYESVQQNRYLALNAPCRSTHEYLALVKFCYYTVMQRNGLPSKMFIFGQMLGNL